MRSFLKTLLLLKILLFINATAFAQEPFSHASYEADAITHELDLQATAQAPWEVGEVVVKGENVYRCFLGITSQGYYLVQNFNINGNLKRTDPFLIRELQAVTDIKSNLSDMPIEGKLTLWYKNGNQWGERTFLNGKVHGTRLWWHPNGQLAYQAEYTEGERHGRLTRWYESGNMERKEFYQHDKRHGRSTFWYDNGQMKSDGHYQEGQITGVYRTWHENGAKAYVSNYKNGELEGIVVLWDEDGRRVTSKCYAQGERVTGTWNSIWCSIKSSLPQELKDEL